MSYDSFARRVGEKYPWLHPDYDPDDGLWQTRAVKARAALKASAIEARRAETHSGSVEDESAGPKDIAPEQSA